MDDISWLEDLKYRFLNIHPNSEAIKLITREGKCYWFSLVGKRPREIFLGKNARHCGTLRILWHKNRVLELCDIYLPEKHRGNGLGTQLIQWLINYARNEKMIGIWGMVVSEKDQDFDRLMAWYLRNGFQKDTPSSKSVRLIL